MNLWLPATVQPALRSQRPRVASYIPLGQITDRSVEIADLTTHLARFRRSDLIRWVCLASAWVEVPNGYSVPHQEQLAQWWLSDPLREGVAAFRRRKGGDG